MNKRRDPELLRAEGDLLPAARAYCEEGRHREAAALYAGLSMYAEAARCMEHEGELLRAHRYLLLGRDWPRAARIRARVLKKATDDHEAASELSAALLELDRPAEAAEILESMGDLEGALGALRAAGDRRGEARLEALAGAHDRAAALLEEWLEEREEEADGARADVAGARRDLGRALLRAGRPGEAAPVLQRLLHHGSNLQIELREDALALLLRAFETLDHPAAAEEAWAVHRCLVSDPSADRRSWIDGREDWLDETGDPEGDRVVAGRYRLEGLLGSGGAAQVYQALDERTGGRVALKLIAGGASGAGGVQRFFREAKIASVLEHPGLVRVLEAAPEKGFIVMELLRGGTLADRLGARGRLNVGAVRGIGLELADCLGAVHRRGVLHRDVKPENILFDEAGRPRLCDLGAAHLISFRQTESGYLLGTLAYMAPEQLAGGRLSAATDVFALGVTLYRALSGRLPFPGPDIAAQHGEGAPPLGPLLTGWPPGSAGVVERTLSTALRTRPADRFPDMAAFALSLEGWPSSEREGSSKVEASGAGSGSDGNVPVAGEPGEGEVEARVDRYRPLLELGERVSLAHDHVLGRMVVLERAPRSDASSWSRRVMEAAARPNQNLQAVLDFDEGAGLVVWQWIEGEPLAASRGPMEVEDAVRASADLASALSEHPGEPSLGRVLLFRGRILVTLAGSGALLGHSTPPADARPLIRRALGRMLDGSSPKEGDIGLDEIVARCEEAPAAPRALAEWLRGGGPWRPVAPLKS